MFKKTFIVIIILVIVCVGYWNFARPWMAGWGATKEEITKNLPGDEIVTNPKYVTNHAIDIEAMPDEVWPWLVQMGQEKGGLYSWEYLSNLAGSNIHNAGQIIPEYQNTKVGDSFKLHPDLPALKVMRMEKNKAFVVGAKYEDGKKIEDVPIAVSWAFILEKTDKGNTRVHVRYISDFKPTLAGKLANHYLLEPFHFIMERAMLYGIKERVEKITPI